MKESDLISVIVPVYNVEKYLDECLTSIIQQTYRNVEIILVNDGSTDSSREICEKYLVKDTRVHLYSKDNGGLSSARNYALDKANGQFVIFVDSDDFWTDNSTLDKLLVVAKKTGADVVRGDFDEFDDSARMTTQRQILDCRGKIANRIVSNDVFIRDGIHGENFVWLYLYKRDAISELRFNEKQRFQEDIDFNIRLFIKPLKSVYVPLKFYAYRKRGNSLTSRINTDNIKYSFCLCDTYAEYSMKTDNIDVRRIYQLNSVMMYYWTLDTLSSSPYYEDRSSIIEMCDLKALCSRTRQRIYRYHIFNKSYFVCLFPPAISAILVRFKNKAYKVVHKLIS